MDFLTEKAKENGTYVVTASFTDETGSAVTPTTLTWTLTDEHGNVINSRQDVSVATPGASNTIVLSGLDLDVKGDEDEARIMTFEGTYSSTNGTGLPLADWVKFVIEANPAI